MPLEPKKTSTSKRTPKLKKDNIRKLNKKDLIRRIIIEAYENQEKSEIGDVVFQSVNGRLVVAEYEYKDMKNPRSEFIENYKLNNMLFLPSFEGIDSHGREIEPYEFIELCRLRKSTLQTILAEVRNLPYNDEQGNPLYY